MTFDSLTYEQKQWFFEEMKNVKMKFSKIRQDDIDGLVEWIEALNGGHDYCEAITDVLIHLQALKEKV